VSFKLDILEMACTHKLQELDDDEYIALLQFGLLLPCITHLQDAGFVQHLYHCTNPVYSKVVRFLAAEVQHLVNSGEATCIVLAGRDLEHHMGKAPISLNQSDGNLCSSAKLSLAFGWMKLNP